MSSFCHSALASLDHSLALLSESLEELKSAKPIAIAEVIEQLKMATESARIVRELMWSELPEASWQNREELDALVEKIQKVLDARTLEQRRFPLLALATELERGTIVHRRAQRVNELNKLRDQAIKELRSQAESEGAPPTLPGPQADQWIEWACGLQEAQDAESLQALHNGFAHVDDFIANLEPSMWIAGESPASQTLPQAEKSGEKTQTEQPQMEAREFEEPAVSSGPIQTKLGAGGLDKPRLPDPRDELPPGLESNTLTPNDITPPRTDEENQWMQAQERALLAGVMGLVKNPVGHFAPTAERPFTAALFRDVSPGPTRLDSGPVGHVDRPAERQSNAEGLRTMSAAAGALVSDPVDHATLKRLLIVEDLRETSPAVEPLVSDPIGHVPHERSFAAEDFHETSTTPEICDARTGVEEPRDRKWRRLLATPAVLVFAALLLFAVLGAVVWRLSRTNTAVVPVKVVESKTVAQTRSNPEDNGLGQSKGSINSETSTPNTKTRTKEQPKPEERGVTPASLSKASPAGQPRESDKGVLRPPMVIPGNTAVVKKEEAQPNDTAEMPGLIPGGLTSGSPNRLGNIVTDIPVALPKIAEQKVRVSSGVAQGLLVHQVTPQYPPSAKQARAEGTVLLQAVIGKDGSVQNLHVLSGNPMLIQAAMDAVRQWRYKPYQLNGEPIEADTQIAVKFKLPD